MGYTSGNWKVTLGGTELPENQRIIQAELGREDGIMNIRTICKTFDYGEPAEMVANAHLIAAAPELYEALKALVAHFRTNDEAYFASDLCTGAIAAIRKAEGR